MSKPFFLSVVFAAIWALSSGQTSPEYVALVKKADSLYQLKEYKLSALNYSNAFKSNGWKGLSDDRYNAACSWARAGYPDSAFFNLFRIAQRSNYTNYDHITTDSDLVALYKDERWKSLIQLVKENKEKTEANYNWPLIKELDTIYNKDQGLRIELESLRKQYGNNSKDEKELWNKINRQDSINQVQVESILDKYGWLGPDVIGGKGNITLFLVIQHADLKVQEKYCPMMKEAVKNGKANPADFALLQDRIEMRNKRPQIYGSQIIIGPDNKNSFYEILDEKNVDKRRTEVGLEPLEEYAKLFGIEYKLPDK